MMFNITPKIFDEVNDALALLGNLGRERQFKKSEFISREGEAPSHLFYMRSGLVKCFQLQEGKEIILRLMTDNSAVLAYSGFITNNVSTENIECIQACHGLWIPIAELEAMRANNPSIDLIFRYMAEQHYLSMERRLMMLHHRSSQERYRYFCKHMEPKIVEQTPLHCVASYLGITPESFSRMKRKLIK